MTLMLTGQRGSPRVRRRQAGRWALSAAIRRAAAISAYSARFSRLCQTGWRGGGGSRGSPPAAPSRRSRPRPLVRGPFVRGPFAPGPFVPGAAARGHVVRGHLVGGPLARRRSGSLIRPLSRRHHPPGPPRRPVGKRVHSVEPNLVLVWPPRETRPAR